MPKRMSTQSVSIAYAAGVAAFLFDQVRAADEKTRAAARFRERQAGLNQFLDLLVEVKAQLVVKFVLDRVAANQRSQTIRIAARS